MKKYILLLATITLILIGVGCKQPSVSGNSTIAHSASTLRVTAVLPHDDSGYWSNVAQGALSAQKDFPVDVKISLPSVNYSIPQMTELIKAATAAQVDAIIVQGVDDRKYIEALKNAQRSGTQIVFVDTDLPDFPPHLYIGTDNYAAGILLGKKLVSETNGQAHIGVISGAPGYPNLDLRIDGVRSVIRDYPNMSIESIEYDQYDSMTVMEKYRLLSDESMGIDTLVCVEGTAALTMSGMLDKRADCFRYVTGFDYSTESVLSLRKGLIDGLILQQPNRMGYQAIQEIYKYANEGSYSHNVINTDTIYITADDLNEEGNYIAP